MLTSSKLEEIVDKAGLKTDLRPFWDHSNMAAGQNEWLKKHSFLKRIFKFLSVIGILVTIYIILRP